MSSGATAPRSAAGTTGVLSFTPTKARGSRSFASPARRRRAPSSRSSREGSRIDITGDGVDVQITAIVGINPHGDCRYYVGEGEYLGWEVRKQALDQLFFEESED